MKWNKVKIKIKKKVKQWNFFMYLKEVQRWAHNVELLKDKHQRVLTDSNWWLTGFNE